MGFRYSPTQALTWPSMSLYVPFGFSCLVLVAGTATWAPGYAKLYVSMKDELNVSVRYLMKFGPFPTVVPLT